MFQTPRNVRQWLHGRLRPPGGMKMMSAFDTVLPPLKGIDRYAVRNNENAYVAHFRVLRTAIVCARMFRRIGAEVVDTETGNVVYSQR